MAAMIDRWRARLFYELLTLLLGLHCSKGSLGRVNDPPGNATQVCQNNIFARERVSHIVTDRNKELALILVVTSLKRLEIRITLRNGVRCWKRMAAGRLQLQ